jgi:hypothetical protein
MRTFHLTNAAGDVLDTVTVTGDMVSYNTGAAESIVESRARSRGCPPADACAELAGCSNGYIRFVEEGQG